jgi:hypothetical protein
LKKGGGEKQKKIWQFSFYGGLFLVFAMEIQSYKDMISFYIAEF